MATMTISHAHLAVGKDQVVSAATPVNAGFFTRLVTAIQESRMRQAQIEIRRARAMIADTGKQFDEALLPFRGE